MQEFHRSSLVLSDMLLGKEAEAWMGDSAWSPPLPQRDAPSRLQQAAQQWLLPVPPAGAPPDSSYLLGLSPAAEQGKRSQIPPGESADSPPPSSGIEPLIIELFPL